MKEKFSEALKFIAKHNIIFFPILIIAVVAITVSLALSARGGKMKQVEDDIAAEQESVSDGDAESAKANGDELVLMEVNEDGAVFTMVATYYDAVARGDVDKLREICDVIGDEEALRVKETSKYLEGFPVIEIYTKPGYEEGDTIAYVYFHSTFYGQDAEYPGYQGLYITPRENGELMIKKDNFSEEANEYIMKLSTQGDVVEFNNRVTVEYNDLISGNPDLLKYISELDNQVGKLMGVLLAQQVSGQDTAVAVTNEAPAEAPEESTEGSIFARANTTANLRQSDSEQAEKVGSVPAGSRVEVLEQRVNGWSKIKYEGKESFIKNEFLDPEENIADLEVIGTVTATTTINVRAKADQSSARLGVMTNGETADLLAREGDWCKIVYNDAIGYVKGEYVR